MFIVCNLCTYILLAFLVGWVFLDLGILCLANKNILRWSRAQLYFHEQTKRFYFSVTYEWYTHFDSFHFAPNGSVVLSEFYLALTPMWLAHRYKTKSFLFQSDYFNGMCPFFKIETHSEFYHRLCLSHNATLLVIHCTSLVIVVNFVVLRCGVICRHLPTIFFQLLWFCVACFRFFAIIRQQKYFNKSTCLAFVLPKKQILQRHQFIFECLSL